MTCGGNEPSETAKTSDTRTDVQRRPWRSAIRSYDATDAIHVSRAQFPKKQKKPHVYNWNCETDHWNKRNKKFKLKFKKLERKNLESLVHVIQKFQSSK